MPAHYLPDHLRLALLAGLLALLGMLSIGIGSVSLSVAQVWTALWGGGDETLHTILWQLRVPRCLTALLAGAALATAGLLMQSMFQNPLAGPDVLGVSAGANLGVAVAIIGLGSWLPIVDSRWGLVTAAVAGSVAAMALIVLGSLRLRDHLTLLIIGLMVASAVAALVGILEFFATAEQTRALVVWGFGSLAGVAWAQLQVLALVVMLSLLAAWLGSKQLDLLQLGAVQARSLGMALQRQRTLLILLVCVLTGVVTAYCGLLAFIGIAVPHLARVVVRAHTHRILVPAAALMGGVVLLACDILSRLPYAQGSLPINAITALVGAPVVVWVVLRRKPNVSHT